MSSNNKEIKVTFRGVDKTREAFGKIRQNFRKLQDQLGRVKLGFGKIGTAITAAFGAAALKKIIDSGEEIGKLANRLDISTNSLSELKYVAGACGVEFSTLTISLEQMAMRISDAARNSGEAQDALRLLGLSANELSQLAPNEQISRIAEELLRVRDASDRTKLAIKLFGSEGTALLPILEQGADGIKRLREEAKALGLSLSRDDCAAIAKFNEELAKLQAVMTSLITSVLVPILPLLTSFFAAIREGHPLITFIITAISTLLAFRLAAWFIAAATAVRAFSIALTASPFGLVAVAISTVVAGLVTLSKSFNKSTKDTERFNQTLEKTKTLTAITIPKETLEVMSKKNELQNEATRIFEQTRTPLEKYNMEMEKLNKLLKQGLIDQETYNRALEQNKQMLGNMADESENVFNLIKDRSKDAAGSLIDNFANAAFSAGGHIKSLKETFNDFFSQMQADMLKMTLKQAFSSFGGDGNIFGGLFGSAGSKESSSSLFGGFFAKGGTVRPNKAHVVGDGGEPELFIPNSVGSIVPFSKLEGLGASSNNIVVNMNIQTPDISSFNQSRSQIAADMARQIARSSRNL
jgi:hypothetical protein